MAASLEIAEEKHVHALEHLARLTFTATFGHLYTAENLENHLSKTCSSDFFQRELANGITIVLAYNTAEYVGYIKYGAVGLPITHHPDDREIHRLYVVPSCQKQGIGQQLMEYALNDPYLSSAHGLYLGVWEDNTNAQAFYARYGFKPVGDYHYYVGTHADREIIMCRKQNS